MLIMTTYVSAHQHCFPKLPLLTSTLLSSPLFSTILTCSFFLCIARLSPSPLITKPPFRNSLMLPHHQTHKLEPASILTSFPPATPEEESLLLSPWDPLCNHQDSTRLASQRLFLWLAPLFPALSTSCSLRRPFLDTRSS